MQLSSIAILLFFCCTCLSGSKAECNCPEGWVNSTTSCYLFTENAMERSEAWTYCKSKNGIVIEITNAAEEAFITNYMYTLDQFGGEFWIEEGYTAGVMEYKLYTSTCLKFTYRRPASMEDSGNCASDKKQVICEFDCTE